MSICAKVHWDSSADWRDIA